MHEARALRTPWRAVTLFLLPALTLYVAFTAYPVVRTLWNSLHVVLPNKRRVRRPRQLRRARARTTIFWRAVRNTLIWACTSPLFEVSIGLLLALALYAKVPGARFFRIAWFTPVLMSYVVVGDHLGLDLQLRLGRREHALRALGLGSRGRAPGSASRRRRCRR